MENNIQIVITGASGFVAKNLRRYLSGKNIKLISLSRNDFKSFKNEVKIISRNYDEKSILPIIQNSDVLIHLVGIGKQSIQMPFRSIVPIQTVFKPT
jgi:NADH dehydrogenase